MHFICKVVIKMNKDYQSDNTDGSGQQFLLQILWIALMTPLETVIFGLYIPQ